MGSHYKDDGERITKNVIVDLHTDCWEWQLGRDKSGYGRLSLKGKVFLAHRIIYEFLAGPIPEGVCVVHSCGNPGCVNPEHLLLGNHRGVSLLTPERGLAGLKKAGIKPKMSREKIKQLKQSLSTKGIRKSRVTKQPGTGERFSVPTIVVGPSSGSLHLGVSFGESIYWVADQITSETGLITATFWDTQETFSSAKQETINLWVLEKWKESVRNRRPQV